MSTEKNRRRRIELFNKQQGLCYWCRRPMHLVRKPGGGRCSSDTCTLDHVYDKWNPMRTPDGGYENVAACFKCNVERSTINQMKATFDARDPSQKKRLSNRLVQWNRRRRAASKQTSELLSDHASRYWLDRDGTNRAESAIQSQPCFQVSLEEIMEANIAKLSKPRAA